MTTSKQPVALAFALTAFVVLTVPSRDVRANSCVFPWSWPNSTVDVWVKSGSASILGLSSLQMDQAVLRATSIWSEESGSAARLRYRGTSTASNNVPGAIYIKGISSCNTALGYWDAELLPNDVKYKLATIDVYTHQESCTPNLWTTDFDSSELTGNSVDLVAVLVHELGHAMSLKHSDDPGNCNSATTASVMTSYYPVPEPGTGTTMLAGRTPRRFDQTNFQYRQVRRSEVALLAVATRTGANWLTAPLYGATSAWHRPGSATHSYPFSIVPWNYKKTLSPSNAGQAREAYYLGSDNTYNDIDIVGRAVAQGPVAIAVDPSNSHALVAYLRAAPGLGSTEYLCWKISMDGGNTFGGEQCQTIFQTPRYGLTAAFDPRTRVFIVGVSNPYGNLSFVTIPSQGSSTPSAITTLSAKSWHAPSIACRNSANGCRVAWEDKSTDGCLKWLEAQIDSATGSIQPGIARTQCFFQYDTPSIAYYEGDATYRLAFIQGNSAVYSYSMGATGTSWAGTGDIWNSALTATTAPVLSTEKFCLFGCAHTLRSFSLRYVP